jgi:hypothetical protein
MPWCVVPEFAKLAWDRPYGRQHSVAAMSTSLATAHALPGQMGLNRFHFQYQIRCSLHHLRQAVKCQLVMPQEKCLYIIIQYMFRAMIAGCDAGGATVCIIQQG